MPVEAAETPKWRVEEIQARLGSCDPHIVRSAADEVIAFARTGRDPIAFYLAAAALEKIGSDEDAAFLFLAAQLSARRQALVEKGDAPQIYGLYAGLIGRQLTPTLESDPDLAMRATRRALSWDSATPYEPRKGAPVVPEEIETRMKGYSARLTALPQQLRDDPVRVARARDAKAAIDRESTAASSRICAPGTLDAAELPSAVAQIKRDAERFVAADPLVQARARGYVERVSVATSTTRGDGVQLPVRLTVSVNGSGKAFFAEVDVRTTISQDRKLGSVDFTLACITDLWHGQRDVSWKDVCTGDPHALKPGEVIPRPAGGSN